MAEGDNAPTVKDLAVLVPFVASSLAISWEVGRFIPFGGFVLFSLSEHLLAAMAALPLALAVTVYFGCIFLVVPPVLRKLAEAGTRVAALPPFAAISFRTSKMPQILRWTIASISVLFWVALGAILLYFVWKNVRVELRASIYPVAFLIAVLLLNSTYFLRPLASQSMLALLGGTAILLAMTLSVDNSNLQIRKSKAGNSDRVVDITLKAGTVRGYLVMSGERGALVYSPDSDKMIFQRADEIQKLEWHR